MQSGGVVKKGLDIKSKISKDYLPRINLVLLLVLIIMVGGLAYYSLSGRGTTCSTQDKSVITNVYEHLGDKQILITNTTTTNSDNNLCYLSYMCVNNTPPQCENPSCIETNSNENCMMNNSKCCSGCCKYTTNGQSVCVSESECSPQSCREEDQTCTTATASGYAVATYPGTYYNYSLSCCAGLSCINGICKKQCSDVSRTCVNNSDCCSGLYCLMGLCSQNSCVPETQTCLHNSDCCSGLNCTNYLCTRPYCAHLSETCGYGINCCSGLSCNDGFCANSSCSTSGKTCSSNSNCCSGLTCQGGLCYTCIPYKQSCASNSSCCSGICTLGFCDE